MTDSRIPIPSPRTDAFRGVTLLVLVVALLAVLMRGCDDDAPEADAATEPASTAPAATAPATTEPAATVPATPSPRTSPPAAVPTTSQARVPDVTGRLLDDATETLRSHGKRLGVWQSHPSSHDLSPRNRGQWLNENWTVAATRPAAGELWAPGTELHLFVLRNEEWAWFRANPTMPAVPVGVDAGDLTGPGQLFAGVRELVEHRYADGHAPEYASPPYVSPDRPIEGLADDPSIEPASETQPRNALARASSYSLTVGSLPVEATALRTGQLLTLTVRDRPSEPVEPVGGAEYGVGGSYSDDDDVDVPGWLCPTRFC